MNIAKELLLLSLFVLCNLRSQVYLQTYSYTYTGSKTDTLVFLDTLDEKKSWSKSITSSGDQNYVKVDNYGLLFYSNSANNIYDVNLLPVNHAFVLFDFYKHLAWTSRDSGFLGLEYILPKNGKVLSSTLIQYDLEPGIYIIVDKDLPAWICPQIFIHGLEYGVRTLVAGNAIIELKNYAITQSTPSFVGNVREIFSNISPSSVMNTYPSYPKISKSEISIKPVNYK